MLLKDIKESQMESPDIRDLFDLELRAGGGDELSR